MRSRCRILIRCCGLPFIGLLITSLAFAQLSKPVGPVFTGNVIPFPPKQNSPWSPPESSLPEKFVTATVALFNQGLADPRDCEYREVELFGGSVWGDSRTFRTHAWVLPRTSENDSQFAIGWNGLVYPVIAVYQPANVRSDIEQTIKKDEEARARYKLERRDSPFYRFRLAISNYGSLSPETMLPLKACLLLRLGETQLAERLWNAWTEGMDPKANDDAIHLRDPYLMLASDLMWALFDRAVIAHMQRDDKLAMLTASELSRIRPIVEAETDRRQITKRTQEYLRFLEPLPLLLADERRRVEARSTNSFSLETDLKLPDKQLRVAALVRDLEEVSARQWGQPGGVSLREDPVIEALITQGEAAIEPLIDVIENDTRLTRSVSFHRDFGFNRNLIGVHEAAYVALVEILKTSHFSPTNDQYSLLNTGMSGRRKIAAEIRNYVREFANVPPEERWYRILKDDAASAEQWQEAAAFIIQRNDQNFLPSPSAFTDAHAPGPGDAFQLRGEPLRAKTNPSVSELLILRMDELASQAAGDSWYLTMQKAVDFALALGVWSGSKSLPELQRLTHKLIADYASVNGDSVSRQPYLIGLIVSLELKRRELKDVHALSEYASWLQTVKPAEADYETEYLFTPALRYADATEIKAAMDHMFRSSSSWNPLLIFNELYSLASDKSLGTLMDFRGFRDAVLKGLADKSVVGTLTPRPASPNDKYDLKIANATAAAVASPTRISTNGTITVSWTVISISRTDSQAPRPPLSSTTFRTCDVYAWKLRGYEGAPPTQLYWTESQRDAAVAAMIEFIRNHTAKFIYSAERAYKYTQ